ncbi:fructosamine kinase family protein [Cellulomonas gelida]|uniref:Fructosamine kinase n=1 Tax=Cellulomonas gelida TaxID=1712 RepID=A0A4Y3KG48_9CELL|nr:fructosamine kinase [Cellulomonas gelida]GGL35355.1 fructosamine kinase [Cellulomonas gelida]
MFRKSRPGAPSGFFACEAAGLEWLRAAAGTPVVRVLDVAEDHLDLERLVAVPPSRDAAAAFGRLLARTHAAGAPAFGSPPAGWDGDGWFGPLDAPLTMPAGRHERWGEFLAVRRLRPLAALLLGIAPTSVLDRLARVADRAEQGAWDDDEPPARLHGDLWAGNVVWTRVGATLIDPAAHGGHRETDLAMLALFGLPHLDEVLAAYDDERPLREGWRRRVALHQLYPVGVHAVLFGGHYVAQLGRLLASLHT